MQGADKALAVIGGARMIDRVLARLQPQAGTILLSARHDYGTGLTTIADGPLGPAGPVGAIRAIAVHVAESGAERFVTASVDAPFVPDDLVARLEGSCDGRGGSTMARCDGAWQPTFACWNAADVIAALPAGQCADKWSLRRLGEALGMQPVDFTDASCFINVNTPQELVVARQQAELE